MKTIFYKFFEKSVSMLRKKKYFSSKSEEEYITNWLISFVRQFSLNLITPMGLPVIENLQNLKRVFILIIIRRKKRTLGIQEIFTTTRL